MRGYGEENELCDSFAPVVKRHRRRRDESAGALTWLLVALVLLVAMELWSSVARLDRIEAKLDNMVPAVYNAAPTRP